MGVEYRHFLIPRPNSFKPSARQLAEFIASLSDGAWTYRPGTETFRRLVFDWPPEAAISGVFATTPNGYEVVPYPVAEEWLEQRDHHDLLLTWPVWNLAEAGLRYPLKKSQWPPGDIYYDLEIHLSPNYVYQASECIEPFEEVICRECSEPLEESRPLLADDFEYIFFTSRIPVQCPKCQAPFDPSKLTAVVVHGWTGERSRLPGGATYRFAVVVDCGKSIPSNTGDIAFDADFVALCKSKFRTDFYEVGDPRP